jgi:UDP-glucose 4-epimerase
VSLVLHAFEYGEQGDLFVQKAPAATVQTMAEALLHIFDSRQSINIIGTRHGEKLFESLLSREEMVKAIDLGSYYRVPMDSRDLNYGKYFVSGSERVSEVEDYTSHNTQRLSVDEVQSLLRTLPYIREVLND